MAKDATPGLKSRLRRGDALVGCFVKSASHHVVEVLAGAGLDFVVLDAEHAPFGRADMDRCILAARAHGLPCLVRTLGAREEALLSALDLGAEGVVVPHVDSAAKARRVAAACRYKGGTRGFSASHRAAGYGKLTMPDAVAAGDDTVCVVCQIEDAGGVAEIDAIAREAQVDCLFVGRADLALALDADGPGDAAVARAVDKVLAACQAAGRPSGIFLPEASDIDRYKSAGTRLFVIGSDQSLLKSAGKAMAARFRSADDDRS